MSRNWAASGKADQGHFPDRTASFSCLVFVVALTIPLANARGATLALGGLIVALIFRIARRRKSGRRAWYSTALSLSALLLGGSIFLLISAPSLEEGLQRTERQLLQHEQDAGSKYPELRGYLWEDALKAFAARPLNGWGIGSYVHVQLIFAGDKLRSLGDGVSPPLVEFTHNDYLQWLVEFGLLGTVLLITPPLAAMIKVFKLGRIGTSDSWIGIGLLALLFTAMIDFPFGNPAIALCFGWLAGLTYATSMMNGRS